MIPKYCILVQCAFSAWSESDFDENKYLKKPPDIGRKNEFLTVNAGVYLYHEQATECRLAYNQDSNHNILYLFIITKLTNGHISHNPLRNVSLLQLTLEKGNFIPTTLQGIAQPLELPVQPLSPPFFWLEYILHTYIYYITFEWIFFLCV